MTLPDPLRPFHDHSGFHVKGGASQSATPDQHMSGTWQLTIGVGHRALVPEPGRSQRYQAR
jgi:hypothetical protein